MDSFTLWEMSGREKEKQSWAGVCPLVYIKRVKPVLKLSFPRWERLSGQWGPSLPPQALLLAHGACTVPLSLSNIHVTQPWFPLSRRDPGTGVLYQTPLHQGCVSARALAVAKGLLQVFTTLVNHGLSREERVGGWRWRGPIFMAFTRHPYLWEKAERNQYERNGP